MGSSLIDFARSFEKFKSDLSRSVVPDHQLLCFIRFWPEMRLRLGDESYSTYVGEWLAIVSLVTEEALFDLSPDELEVLGEILGSLASFAGSQSVSEALKGKLKLVRIRLIKLLFYLGRFERGLELSAELTGVEELPGYDPSLLDGLDSYECLEALFELCSRFRVGLGNLLKKLLDEWEAERTGEDIDLTWCVFVETNEPGGGTRGRLRRLKGLVEVGPSSGGESKETDTVSFDNQVKSPDDPLIGAVYDSLQAVRNLLDRSGLPGRLKGSYRSFYSIEDRQYAFTGDSIGLAASLVAYTQLLKGEVLRERRRISSAVGFTGGVDGSGALLPVNKETLVYKLKRAFCSHLKQVVVPEDSLAEATACLQKLSEEYPRRRLRLVGFRRLNEVVDSRDVLPSQRLGMGGYLVRKVYRHSKGAKVQVPLLLVVAYALLCLVYPKAWIGFDWSPANLELTQNGFVVTNSSGHLLWEKDNICTDITHSQASQRWVLANLDDDPQKEVLFLPEGNPAYHCELNAHLLIYDHNGGLLSDRKCAVPGEYPGDDSDSMHYFSLDIRVLDLDHRRVIKTEVGASYPARGHNKFWSLDGKLLGWYVQAGFGGSSERCAALDDRSRYLRLHVNNRLKGAGFYALYPESAYGVSPPYEDAGYDLSWVKRGNQICYISLPRSDVGLALGTVYDAVSRLRLESGRIRADVTPGPDCNQVLTYLINDEFRVYDVLASDSFVKTWDSLSTAGALSNTDRLLHLTDLLSRVAYWTDSGWVTEGQLRALGQ
jgi:hypothetical protein